MSISSEIEQDWDEIQEWLEALEAVRYYKGDQYAAFLVNKVAEASQKAHLPWVPQNNTAYINTLTSEHDQAFPGDEAVEVRITAIIRWNALMMVLRAVDKDLSLGGHIASYASAATLYEVGFHHFFRALIRGKVGDLVLVQGHSSPGIYARMFLEGRLSTQHLDNFRQEVDGNGLSSYPHPWLMPDLWQFPTVSMGLGMLQAIYHARLMKYLQNRGFYQDQSDQKAAQSRKVWFFAGDGEMDEPESLGALTVASRELLDNLIVVVNCNLQRLDGPVRGNGQIIQELERLFHGAGWRVIKVIWGSAWDPLLRQDISGRLQQRMIALVDGDYQRYSTKDMTYFREHFFGVDNELAQLVADWSDEALSQLIRGGHDIKKVYAAYKAATESNIGQPTVILAKTVKGYGLGQSGEGQNIIHQQKKVTFEQLKQFRDRFQLPISDQDVRKLTYYKPNEDSLEMQYLYMHREALGGYLPQRNMKVPPIIVPCLESFQSWFRGSEGHEISTTMAYVRMLQSLLKNEQLGQLIVPIVADEARTFGMEGLFRQIGIYSPVDQCYQPVDSHQLLCYREAKTGQLLQEGINEAGAFSAWLAAATAYSVHQQVLIPFYIYYAMFGIQRIGDLAWVAADSQARGFLLGGLAGRTTLAGEGLQHQDAHNLVFFSAIPNCISYDPAFGYELAVIIQDGLQRMLQAQENVFYYITLMNEHYVHPPMPAGVEKGIIQGMYLFAQTVDNCKLANRVPVAEVQLLGSGAVFNEVIKAARLLSNDFNVGAYVWSVTSFTELRREGLAIERENRFNTVSKPKLSYVTSCLQAYPGPVIAATDYMRLNAEQIRAFVPHTYVVLGTDGFGRSDTREKLRDFFEVSAAHIVLATLKALADAGKLPQKVVAAAMEKYYISPSKKDPAYL